jgi:hydroxymethylbilane synthase
LLSAERFVVQALGATCHTPVGVHADGTTVRAYVGKADGSAWIRDEVAGPDAPALIVERLRAMGAEELLRG